MSFFGIKFGGNSPPQSPPEERFTVQNLRLLHDRILENKVVTKENLDMMVESLRMISEMVVYGDKKSEILFDCFCERNMLPDFMLIMQSSRGFAQVQIQILQTLSILCQCVRNPTSLYYLLSNNYINNFLEYDYDFDQDGVRDHYVSFMKSLSLRMDIQTIQFFFNEFAGTFPILTCAIDQLRFKDPMVRVAAQSTILNVLRVDDEKAREFALKDQVLGKLFKQIGIILEAHFQSCVLVCLEYDAHVTHFSAESGATAVNKSKGNSSSNGSSSLKDSLMKPKARSLSGQQQLNSLLAKTASGGATVNKRLENQLTDILNGNDDWLLYVSDLLMLNIDKLTQGLIKHFVGNVIHEVILDPLLVYMQRLTSASNSMQDLDVVAQAVNSDVDVDASDTLDYPEVATRRHEGKDEDHVQSMISITVSIYFINRILIIFGNIRNELRASILAALFHPLSRKSRKYIFDQLHNAKNDVHRIIDTEIGSKMGKEKHDNGITNTNSITTAAATSSPINLAMLTENPYRLAFERIVSTENYGTENSLEHRACLMCILLLLNACVAGFGLASDNTVTDLECTSLSFDGGKDLDESSSTSAPSSNRRKSETSALSASDSVAHASDNGNGIDNGTALPSAKTVTATELTESDVETALYWVHDARIGCVYQLWNVLHLDTTTKSKKKWFKKLLGGSDSKKTFNGANEELRKRLSKASDEGALINGTDVILDWKLSALWHMAQRQVFMQRSITNAYPSNNSTFGNGHLLHTSNNSHYTNSSNNSVVIGSRNSNASRSNTPTAEINKNNKNNENDHEVSPTDSPRPSLSTAEPNSDDEIDGSDMGSETSSFASPESLSRPSLFRNLIDILEYPMQQPLTTCHLALGCLWHQSLVQYSVMLGGRSALKMLQDLLGQAFSAERFPSEDTHRLKLTLRRVLKNTTANILESMEGESAQSTNILNLFQEEIRRMAGASRDDFGRSISTSATNDFGSPSPSPSATSKYGVGFASPGLPFSSPTSPGRGPSNNHITPTGPNSFRNVLCGMSKDPLLLLPLIPHVNVRAGLEHSLPLSKMEILRKEIQVFILYRCALRRLLCLMQQMELPSIDRSAPPTLDDIFCDADDGALNALRQFSVLPQPIRPDQQNNDKSNDINYQQRITTKVYNLFDRISLEKESLKLLKCNIIEPTTVAGDNSNMQFLMEIQSRYNIDLKNYTNVQKMKPHRKSESANPNISTPLSPNSEDKSSRRSTLSPSDLPSSFYALNEERSKSNGSGRSISTERESLGASGKIFGSLQSSLRAQYGDDDGVNSTPALQVKTGFLIDDNYLLILKVVLPTTMQKSDLPLEGFVHLAVPLHVVEVTMDSRDRRILKLLVRSSDFVPNMMPLSRSKGQMIASSLSARRGSVIPAASRGNTNTRGRSPKMRASFSSAGSDSGSISSTGSTAIHGASGPTQLHARHQQLISVMTLQFDTEVSCQNAAQHIELRRLRLRSERSSYVKHLLKCWCKQDLAVNDPEDGMIESWLNRWLKPHEG